ncbi:hypothetical protein M8818_000689 [Zalaria obscura]|uniref:Uncharacterized protein n=1 Tax=Zalaria obscura TaxID=2024903 RepID=A0ACC3SPT4_9PEZI
MQGVSWFVRRAISYSTIVLHVKEYADDSEHVHIDIEQVSSFATTNEERTLDWQFRDHDDRIFGKVRGKTRFVKLGDLDDEFLKTGWDPKWVEESGGEAVEAFVESVGKEPMWTADQVWGFAVVGKGEGEGRRYVRHVVARKGEEVHRIKMVYDWTPKA